MARIGILIATILIIILLFFGYSVGIFSEEMSYRDGTGLSTISESVEIFSPKILESGSTEKSKKFPEISWLGHNGFYISWNNKNILFDPNLSKFCRIIPRRIPAPLHARELPAIDIVLISHAHYDHLDMKTLEEVLEIKNIVVPSQISVYLSKKLLEKSHIFELDEDQTLEIGTIKITAVHANHNGSRYHPFQSPHRATGYVLENEGVRLYLAGDTGYGEFFKDIKNKFSPDIAILPIGSFKPDLILGNFHLSPKDAVSASLDLYPAYIIPSHYGTFRLAFDEVNESLPEFAKLAKDQKLRWGIAAPFSPRHDLNK